MKYRIILVENQSSDPKFVLADGTLGGNIAAVAWSSDDPKELIKMVMRLTASKIAKDDLKNVLILHD